MLHRATRTNLSSSYFSLAFSPFIDSQALITYSGLNVSLGDTATFTVLSAESPSNKLAGAAMSTTNSVAIEYVLKVLDATRATSIATRIDTVVGKHLTFSLGAVANKATILSELKALGMAEETVSELLDEVRTVELEKSVSSNPGISGFAVFLARRAIVGGLGFPVCVSNPLQYGSKCTTLRDCG